MKRIQEILNNSLKTNKRKEHLLPHHCVSHIAAPPISLHLDSPLF